MKEKTLMSSYLTLLFLVFFLGLISACGSSRKINSNYLYFRSGADTVTALQKETVIQPNDLLSIQVYSKTQNQEQAVIFNIPPATNNLIQGYQVSASGNIDMPIIGNIKAVGLYKDQLEKILEDKLTPYVKNPSVLVRFLQFNVNVLGEVRSPGVHKFALDRVTIIDAISAAGDLTDYGKREDVTLIREENGKKIYYTIDLRSRTIFESNVYVLQPNDIIYVGPNRTKLRGLSVDPDAQRRIGLLFSITSVLLSIASFLINTLRVR
jgi:polysaccharide export outer membrane protein